MKVDRPVPIVGAGDSADPSRRKGRSSQISTEHAEAAPDVSAEPLVQAALDALSAHVAVLDTHGIIVGVNRAWRRFGQQNGLRLRNGGIGSDYIAALRRGSGTANLRRRFHQVLRGRMLSFRHSYWCSTPERMRYFEMEVRRCGRSKRRRILVCHEDLTDLKLAEDDLRKLASELESSRDTERRRFARELHDTTCQDLLVAALAVERIEKILGAEHAAAQGLVVELSQTLDRVLRDLRTLSYLLHTPTASASGLADALRMLVAGFARRAEIDVRFSSNYAGRPRESVERVILAVVREALVNIHRHSGSKTARVALNSLEGSLALTITDQGQWCEGAEGVGLASMRQRVAEVGGALTIRPTRRGTSLFARVPT